MTTYRIRPLKWEPCEDRDIAEITRDIYYVAEPSGVCYGMFYDAMAHPKDRATDLASARATCESHWRGVLSAALEPVEGA